jgi:hypothetical protein
MRPPLGAVGSGTTPVLASAEPSPAIGRIAGKVHAASYILAHHTF